MFWLMRSLHNAKFSWSQISHYAMTWFSILLLILTISLQTNKAYKWQGQRILWSNHIRPINSRWYNNEISTLQQDGEQLVDCTKDHHYSGNSCTDIYKAVSIKLHSWEKIKNRLIGKPNSKSYYFSTKKCKK